MTQSSNKFEALLELLINEENDKAEQLFHEIVVDKSRDIYENLASTETKDDTVDENKEDKDEAVKETEKSDTKDEEVKETEKSDKDETVEETVEEVKADESKNEVKDEEAKTESTTSEEEKIEEIGGDATDDLVKDISSDEEGDADAAADELAPDMEPTGEPEGDTEERVADLEDALEELKAEFEKMMGHEVGDGEEGSEEESLQVQPEMAPQIQPTISNRPFEGKKAEAKETVKEYKIQKSADAGDHADNKKSSVASNAKGPNSASPHRTSSKEETGRTAPGTSDVRSGEFANEGGKDSRKLSDASSKVSKTDGADNKKSPVVAARK